MLTKRTNLLLEEMDYRLLSELAKKEDVSIGELIRKAIRKTYHSQRILELEERKKVVEKILKFGEKFKIKKINYKKLIEYGRKH